MRDILTDKVLLTIWIVNGYNGIYPDVYVDSLLFSIKHSVVLLRMYSEMCSAVIDPRAEYIIWSVLQWCASVIYIELVLSE